MPKRQMTNKIHPLLFLILILLMETGLAAPITFNTALPVAKGEFLLRQQFISIQSGDDSSSANRDRSETVSATTLVYGVNHKIALFGILPYRDIELNLDMGSGQITRSNHGQGDISLFGRYIFKQDNQPGSTFRMAAFAGFKAPTGDNNSRDNLGKLPAPVQTGTGSWDVFGGLVITRQTLDWQLDAQLSYRLNTEADEFKAGNVLRLDSSWQKRLWPDKLSTGVPGFLYGVIEMNLINQRENTLNGVDDGNSGGTRLLLAPGIQYVTRRWIVEGSVQVPVVQQLNGDALELGSILRAGFRVNF